MNVPQALGAHAEPVDPGGPKVYHIPEWDGFGDPKRMDIITNIAKMRGRDPTIATLAVDIFKKAGVEPRDYEGQAQALLDFVQNQLYYVNEPGERLQDPLYTLKVGYGDCDDLVITLGALLESVRIPWRVVISGNKGKKKVRYHHGDKFPGGEEKGYIWSHIYMMIGDRPFVPQKWRYAETTVRGAPLGWDVVDGDASIFPELKNYGAAMYGQAMQLYSPPEQYQTLTRTLPSHSLAVTPEQLPHVVTKGVDPGGYRRAKNTSMRTGPQEADMVAIVVIAPNGNVLALQRGAGVSWMAGKWDLPGGPTGGKYAREAAVEALARETGIITQPQYLRKCSLAYHPEAGTSAFYVYQLPKKQEIMFRKLEHQGYQFISRDELLRSFRTAPYVEIALRACFAPSSLATSPELKGKSAAELAKIAQKKDTEASIAKKKEQEAIANGDYNRAAAERKKKEAAEEKAAAAKYAEEKKAREAREEKESAERAKAYAQKKDAAVRARDAALARATAMRDKEVDMARSVRDEAIASATVKVEEWRRRNPGRPLTAAMNEQYKNHMRKAESYFSDAQRKADDRLKAVTKEIYAAFEAQMKGITNTYGAMNMEEMKMQLAKQYTPLNIPLWMLLVGAGGAYYYYNHMR